MKFVKAGLCTDLLLGGMPVCAKHAHRMQSIPNKRCCSETYPYLHLYIRLGEVVLTSPSQGAASHDTLYVPKGALCACRVVRL